MEGLASIVRLPRVPSFVYRPVLLSLSRIVTDSSAPPCTFGVENRSLNNFEFGIAPASLDANYMNVHVPVCMKPVSTRGTFAAVT